MNIWAVNIVVELIVVRNATCPVSLQGGKADAER